jgi:hypothetical protein
VDGQAISGILVATFTDADPNAAGADYSGSVTWGDGQTSGSAAGNVTIQADPNLAGVFDVLASKPGPYSGPGAFTLAVTVADAGGATASASPVLTVGGLLEGQAVSNVPLTTFTDASDPTASDYSATVAWGDGTTSSNAAGNVTIQTDPNQAGVFDVLASKPAPYAEEGAYSLQISVTNAGTVVATASPSLTVSDAPLGGQSLTVRPTTGQLYGGNIATFTDPGTDGTPNDYSAVINWGDGSTSTASGAAGTITADPVAGFDVAGSHTYASDGTYAVTVILADVGGSQTTVASTAQVSGVATGFTVGAPSGSTAGTSFDITVTAVDASGNVALNYAGTVGFTSHDAQAVLPGGFTFTPGDSGTQTFAAGVDLKTAGSETVAVADTNNGTITGSASVLVSPAAASQLALSAPAVATAGASFGVTLTALDPYGNVATGYAGTDHFSASDARAALPADYTFTATDQGVHTFANLVLDAAGVDALKVADTLATSLEATSNIQTSPAAASQLQLTASVTGVTAGTSFNLSVTALDPYGNVATGYAGTVHFTSTDDQAVLPADYTFTAADAGVHAVSATLKTAGTQSLTATDTSASSVRGSEGGIAVKAAAASQLRISAPVNATAGASSYVTVTALDPYGNVAPTYTGKVNFSSSDLQATLPATFTFKAANAGTRTFSATLRTAGSQTISVKDTSNSSLSATSAGVNVKAASVASFTVVGAATSTAGQAMSVSVTARDTYGNVVTGYRGTVHLASSDGHAVLPANYTFKSTDNGVHTFTVTLKTAGTQTVTLSDTSKTTVKGSSSVIVSAAAAGQVVVLAPTSVTHGVAFSFTVEVLDAYGNLATGYTGTLTFGSSDAAAALPANYTFTAADGGQHTFSTTLNTVGTQSLTATDTLTSKLSATLAGITVN